MRLFKSGELKLLWPFYLGALIFPILFFMPAFVVVYFRDLGFSLFQISLLTMMMPLAMLLFEIPTGAIADLFGRKSSVLLGALIEGLAIFSIFFLENYYALLIAFAIVGFGSTFNSGAREAWITDLIKSKRKDFLHGYFAKGSSIDSLGLVVSGILGVFLVKMFGLSIIWIVAGASYFITIFILSFGEENFIRKKIKVKDSFKEISKKSIKSVSYSRRHPILFLFLIASAILVFASVFSGDLAWVTFLQNLGFPDYAFGYMWSAMGLVGIAAPLISTRLMKKGREKKFIITSIILGILVTSLMFFVNSIVFALSLLLASFFFFLMRAPVERVYFHKFVTSKLRATLGSVETMLIAIIGLIAMPIAGLSVDHLGARYTILLSALIMIPAVIVYLKINEKRKINYARPENRTRVS